MSQVNYAGAAFSRTPEIASAQPKSAPLAGDKAAVLGTDLPEAVQAAKHTVLETPKKLATSTIDPAESRKRLADLIKELSDRMVAQQKGLQFSVDERLGRQIVTVLNKETGEVIRQIPGEAVLRVANSIEDLKGILFDDIF